MAGKIPRVFQKIFGSTAPSSGKGAIGVFGSLAAGSPALSTNLTTVQGLSAWLDGWASAIIGNNSPAIEDMTATFYVITTQLAYLMQQGVAEWDASTTYYQGSMINSAGIIYVSLTDGNTNNAVTNTTNWAPLSTRQRTVTGDTTATIYDDYILVDASGGAVTVTYPPLATAIGKKIGVKKIDSSANAVTVKGNSAELIDFANTFAMTFPGDSLTGLGSATAWWIV